MSALAVDGWVATVDPQATDAALDALRRGGNEIDAERLKSVADELAQFPASRAIYWRPDGRPCQAGDRVRIADLAQTYRRIAQEGVAWFYRGPFAATVAPPPSPCTR
jgi:gamma-glutamyltranspeptidase/glutathione hydrolase